MTILQQKNARNDLLRWYLLLWVCLISLWGLFEISSGAVAVAWRGCSTGRELSGVCAQLKQHLGPMGQPDIASLPPAVLATLLQHAITVFLLFQALYSLLLWFSLSDRRKQWLIWPLLVGQGAITCTLGVFVPALSVMVPASLLLVLILEACALFRQVREILVFSICSLAIFLLSAVFAWQQGTAFSESSLSIIVTLALLVIGLLFVGGFFLLYTRLARAHATLEAAYRQLDAASERIEALTLIMERERMARELHDTLVQGLAGIILQLGVIQARVKTEHYDGTSLILEQTLVSARETLSRARGAISDLRMQPLAPGDLIEAVRKEIQQFSVMAGISCTTKELDLLTQLPPAQIEQITGIIRESLANVARHARAHAAWVHVSNDGQTLRLEIGDDGIGFDPTRISSQPGHYGLRGLQERALLADGELAILSEPGQGTRIQFVRPERCPQNGAEKE